MLVLLLACSDAAVTSDKTVPFDTSAGVDPTGGDSADATTDDPCDGEDNDGNGVVDDGWPDADGNGRADCLDASCPALDAPVGAAVEVDGTCGGTGYVSPDPWNIVQEWRQEVLAPGDRMLPVVGNLTDDNGDGAIDADDIPDIVFGSSGDLSVGLVAGDGSGVRWTATGRDDEDALVADVDGDGVAELVTVQYIDNVSYLSAFDGDGVEKWRAAGTQEGFVPGGAACDMDGDGLPEVTFNGQIVHGVDGSPYATAAIVPGVVTTPICADLDGDGLAELIQDDRVFNSDGTLRFDLGMSGTMIYPALLQADDDPDAELLFAAGGEGLLVDTDGTTLRTPVYAGELPGTPCVADFDGDGDAEFVVPTEAALTMFELDGTKDWTLSIGDTSGSASCSAWDVDGDGIPEVLYAGEGEFDILDGSSGYPDFQSTDHTSETIVEYPVVADVDHDGAGEIITVESSFDGSGETSLTVWGQADDLWPPAGPTWGVSGFSGTDEADDGDVVTGAKPWLDPGMFHGRADDRAGEGTADLGVTILDACIADCTYGPVEVSVQVANAGAVAAVAGATLDLYAVTGADSRLVWETTLPEVPAGTSLDAQVIDLPVTSRGDGSWRAVVVPVDGTADCTTEDDASTWDDPVCSS